MAFRKDKTTSANASLMTAGDIVAGLVAAGHIQTVVDAADALVDLAQRGLDFAGPVVDADNEVFKEAEASGGSTGGGGGGKSRGDAGVADDPGDTVFFGGKFKGCSIVEVYKMSVDEAKGYNHQYGDGASYITNYVATTKNTNETTRDAAKAFLATV